MRFERAVVRRKQVTRHGSVVTTTTIGRAPSSVVTPTRAARRTVSALTTPLASSSSAELTMADFAPAAALRAAPGVAELHSVVLRQQREMDELRRRVALEEREKVKLRAQSGDMSAVFARARSDQEREMGALRVQMAAMAEAEALRGSSSSIATAAAQHQLYAQSEAYAEMRRRALDAERRLGELAQLAESKRLLADASAASDVAFAEIYGGGGEEEQEDAGDGRGRGRGLGDDVSASAEAAPPPPARETRLAVRDAGAALTPASPQRRAAQYDARVASAIEQRDAAIDELERAHSLRSALADVQIETLTQLATAQLAKEEAEAEAVQVRYEMAQATALLTRSGQLAAAQKRQRESAAIVAINAELERKHAAAETALSTAVMRRRTLEKELVASERLRRGADEDRLDALAAAEAAEEHAERGVAEAAALRDELRATKAQSELVECDAQGELASLSVQCAEARDALAASTAETSALRAARDSMREAKELDAAEHTSLLLRAQEAAAAQLAAVLGEREEKHHAAQSEAWQLESAAVRRADVAEREVQTSRAAEVAAEEQFASNATVLEAALAESARLSNALALLEHTHSACAPEHSRELEALRTDLMLRLRRSEQEARDERDTHTLTVAGAAETHRASLRTADAERVALQLALDAARAEHDDLIAMAKIEQSEAETVQREAEALRVELNETTRAASDHNQEQDSRLTSLVLQLESEQAAADALAQSMRALEQTHAATLASEQAAARELAQSMRVLEQTHAATVASERATAGELAQSARALERKHSDEQTQAATHAATLASERATAGDLAQTIRALERKQAETWARLNEEKKRAEEATKSAAISAATYAECYERASAAKSAEKAMGKRLKRAGELRERAEGDAKKAKAALIATESALQEVRESGASRAARIKDRAARERKQAVDAELSAAKKAYTVALATALHDQTTAHESKQSELSDALTERVEAHAAAEAAHAAALAAVKSLEGEAEKQASTHAQEQTKRIGQMRELSERLEQETLANQVAMDAVHERLATLTSTNESLEVELEKIRQVRGVRKTRRYSGGSTGSTGSQPGTWGGGEVTRARPSARKRRGGSKSQLTTPQKVAAPSGVTSDSLTPFAALIQDAATTPAPLRNPGPLPTVVGGDRTGKKGKGKKRQGIAKTPGETFATDEARLARLDAAGAQAIKMNAKYKARYRQDKARFAALESAHAKAIAAAEAKIAALETLTISNGALGAFFGDDDAADAAAAVVVPVPVPEGGERTGEKEEDAAKESTATLVAEIAQLKKESAQLQATLDSAHVEVASTLEERDEARRELEGQVETSAAAAEEVRTALALANAETEAVEADLNEAGVKLKELQAQCAEQRKSLRDECVQLRGDVDVAETELGERSTQLADARIALAERTVALATAEAAAEAAVEIAIPEIDPALLDEACAATARAEAHAHVLASRIDALELELSSATAAHDAVRETAEAHATKAEKHEAAAVSLKEALAENEAAHAAAGDNTAAHIAKLQDLHETRTEEIVTKARSTRATLEKKVGQLETKLQSVAKNSAAKSVKLKKMSAAAKKQRERLAAAMHAVKERLQQRTALAKHLKAQLVVAREKLKVVSEHGGGAGDGPCATCASSDAALAEALQQKSELQTLLHAAEQASAPPVEVQRELSVALATSGEILAEMDDALLQRALADDGAAAADAVNSVSGVGDGVEEYREASPSPPPLPVRFPSKSPMPRASSSAETPRTLPQQPTSTSSPIFPGAAPRPPPAPSPPRSEEFEGRESDEEEKGLSPLESSSAPLFPGAAPRPPPGEVERGRLHFPNDRAVSTASSVSPSASSSGSRTPDFARPGGSSSSTTRMSSVGDLVHLFEKAGGAAAPSPVFSPRSPHSATAAAARAGRYSVKKRALGETVVKPNPIDVVHAPVRRQSTVPDLVLHYEKAVKQVTCQGMILFKSRLMGRLRKKEIQLRRNGDVYTMVQRTQKWTLHDKVCEAFFIFLFPSLLL